MIEAILWSALATGTTLIGMLLAYLNLVGQRWTALLMAFGAGALISAAAYQLVLDAVNKMAGAHYWVAAGIAAGALTYYFADRWVDHLGGADRLDYDGAQAEGSGIGIILGAMLDGIPEALVLGMSFVHSPEVSLAFIFAVAFSNIPEGLGGTAGLLTAGWEKRKITMLWLIVYGLSIVATILGYWFAGSFAGATGALAGAYAAGALLVMLTDSMIPESFEHGGKEAGLSLVLGFSVATATAIIFS